MRIEVLAFWGLGLWYSWCARGKQISIAPQVVAPQPAKLVAQSAGSHGPCSVLRLCCADYTRLLLAALRVAHAEIEE